MSQGETIEFSFVNCFDEKVFNLIIFKTGLAFTHDLLKVRVSETVERLIRVIGRLPKNVYALGEHFAFDSYLIKVNVKVERLK